MSALQVMGEPSRPHYLRLLLLREEDFTELGTSVLDLPGSLHAFLDYRRRFTQALIVELVIFHAEHFDMDVAAI
jgi:hypothetical protein